MAFSGLTAEKVADFREEEFTEDQIAKMNKRAIKKLDEKLQKFTISHPASQRKWPEPEMRLVLLGKTGEGKSATGNLIIGSDRYKDSPSTTSETINVQEETCSFNEVRVRLIDTPGFHDTSRTPQDIATEIAKVIESFSCGVHAFLFVFSISNPRFTKEQEDAFKAVCSESGVFGPEFLNHCFIILTHGNDLARHKSLDDFLSCEQGTSFEKLISSTGRRVVTVDNGDKEEYSREQQKKQVLELVMSRADGVYNNEVFKKFQDHKEEAIKNLHSRLRELAPFIDEELSKHLSKMSHGDIKNMSDITKQSIVKDVLDKVKQMLGSTHIDEEIIKTSILSMLAKKQERLTSNSFLSAVMEFMGPIFCLVGQVVVAVFTLVFDAVGAAVDWFKSWF